EADRSSARATAADAQLSLARWYAFENWQQLAEWATAMTEKNGSVSRFESAIEAIIAGDTASLKSLLDEDAGLIRARSMRRHHSMLLHYVGANGVEGYRQKSPANAVQILRLLLEAGAEADAEADMYGGGSTTLGLTATSIWPAKAGVLVPLLETLLQAGAAIDHPRAAGNKQYAVVGCLHNGRPEAADFLARHGAKLDLEGAAGVGRLDIVREFFNDDGSLKITATRRQMELGFMWACEFGHTAVAGFLLNRGLHPDTLVDGMLGLHWAIIGGHMDTIQLLIGHKASLEIKNTYGGPALDAAFWAILNRDEVYRWPEAGVDYVQVIEALLKAGAEIEPGTLAWLAKQDSLSYQFKERLADVLRHYGANS
ncbi:MAG TPA: ankyrin repeat domain-containing protein, partial [Chitinophagaceae bacterium]|nr:ankyrin repeat domain-containing protein [Chitinophagaceae bacterium]